jgi:hypothetical protein
MPVFVTPSYGGAWLLMRNARRRREAAAKARQGGNEDLSPAMRDSMARFGDSLLYGPVKSERDHRTGEIVAFAVVALASAALYLWNTWL